MTRIRSTSRRVDPGGSEPISAGGVINRLSAVGVGAASLGSAVAAYVALLVAARTLDYEENAWFLAFWAALWATFGVLGGLATEATRAASSGRGSKPNTGNPRLGLVGLVIGLVAAGVLALTGLWWGPSIFGEYSSVLVPLLAAAAAVYSGHAILVGALSGRQRWSTYAALVTCDSAIRLGAVAVVVLLGASVAGFAAAGAAGVVAWLGFLILSGRNRHDFLLRTDIPLGSFLRTSGHACLAAASSAALVVGFPVLLRISTTDAEYLSSAALLMGVTLTRAPLLIPLHAYQNVAIAHFISNKSRGLRALYPIVLGILGVALAGATAAWLLGPWIMVVLLGENYRVSGLVLAALTFDAGMLAILTITGALCIAAHRHRAFSGGWVTATAISFAILWLPLDIQLKSVLSLAAGPLGGIAMHFWFLRSWVKANRNQEDGVPGQVG